MLRHSAVTGLLLLLVLTGYSYAQTTAGANAQQAQGQSSSQSQAQVLSNQINIGTGSGVGSTGSGAVGVAGDPSGYSGHSGYSDPTSAAASGDPVRNFAVPYQLYPAPLATDFGNGNTYGNFVKVPGMFSLKTRFSRGELEAMRRKSGTSVRFRVWSGPRIKPNSPTDYVDFVWEMPMKQKIGPDGNPVVNDKGPVFTTYVPTEWTQLGTGTAEVTNGKQDSYSLVVEYGLKCLDTDGCNTVFFVGEGLKTFVSAWGANISIGATYASVSDLSGNSSVGGVGAGYAYAKTRRQADPWLQGHFVYNRSALPAQ